jgi:HEPN domain-containing protein
VAEKALKALHYGVLEKRFVPGRSLVKLAAELKQEIGEEMKDHLSLLDQYYIPTRYPNGLPDAAPFVVYTARQAREAVEIAKAVLEVARRRLWPEG